RSSDLRPRPRHPAPAERPGHHGQVEPGLRPHLPDLEQGVDVTGPFETMSNRFTPRTWVDTERVFAADVNRIENGIEALDTDLDDVEDRVAAIQAQMLTLSDSRLPYGPSSQQPVPAVGQMYFDTTIGRPIVGDGTKWIEFGAGDPIEGPGSSTAPTNFQAIVQPDNTIVCSWNPVSGASHYKLYEVRSPNGVSGADNLTSTVEVRDPETLGYYEYWVTAFVDGVESAQSNHGICSLPYGSDPEDP